MKILTYKIEGYTSVYNHETQEVEQRSSLAEVVVENPTDEAVTLAKETAYNGEYTIVDDGQPAPDTASTDDVLNALLGVSV